jgi:transposase InsO family protein
MANYNLEAWLLSQNYPAATANLIRHIVNSPPSRKVRSNGKNVRGFYPSKKRGETVQFESHKNELCFIVERENEDMVLDYFDQPPPFTVHGKTAAGRNHGYDITPDFFEIRRDKAGWIECKLVEDLEKLSKENPNRYVRDAKGKWHFLPGEEYASRYGLFFEVYSSDQIDWVRQRNFIFLEDYLLDGSSQVTPEARSAIMSLVKSKTGITVAELLAEPRSYSADDIYALIATSEIFLNMSRHPIAETHRARIFVDREMAEAYSVFNKDDSSSPIASPTINISIGASFMWDGAPWKIINVGNTLLSLQSANNDFIDLSKTTFDELVKQGKLSGLQVQVSNELSEAQLIMKEKLGDSDGMRTVLKKYDAIVPFLSGVAKDKGIKANRTVRLYVNEYKLAQMEYGEEYGLIGLFDENNPGNPTVRISDAAGKLINKIRDDFYETAKWPSKKAAYGYFLILCEKEGVNAVSWKTFRKYLSKERPKDEVKRNREGDRAAYKHEPFHFYLTLTTPRHGDRPFEICHIDHTELDVEIVSSEVNMKFGRPWLTLLTDANTRRDFAFYLTLSKPSYISNMMVLRECVARHGRLPQIVVVDGGADFNKVEFDLLCAKHHVTKKIRPGAKARFGSTCERLFGTTNTELIHNLNGSTKIMKNVRQVTKKNNPKNKAIWPLYDLYLKLEKFLYEEYDYRPHPALGESPREAFNRGLSLFGNRPFRMIPYDDNFIRWTLPRPRKGTSRIDTQRGVKINDIYYHSEILRNPKYEGVIVERRYDPFNVGVAYVYLDKHWVKCYSEYFSVFVGRSMKELELQSTERRQRNIINGRRLAASAKELALRCQAIDQDENILKQRQRDRELKNVHAAMAASRRSPQEKTLAPAPIPIMSARRKSSSNNASASTPVIFDNY